MLMNLINSLTTLLLTHIIWALIQLLLSIAVPYYYLKHIFGRAFKIFKLIKVNECQNQTVFNKEFYFSDYINLIHFSMVFFLSSSPLILCFFKFKKTIPIICK